jgi:hypothetical protein
MKKLLLSCAVCLLLACCSFAQGLPRNVHILRPYSGQPQAPASGKTITYNGGPIMSAPTTVYVIYYGTWSTRATTIVNNFVSALYGSPQFNVNTTYFDNTGAYVQNTVLYDPKVDSYVDNYSFGKSITDSQIQQVVANAISGGHLPNDTNGVYFVLTATDVKDPDGFCSFFCGYHGPSTSIVTGETIKYSMVGNAATQCPSGCIGNTAIYHDKTSPNGDMGADGAVSVIYHELSETVTDPEVNLGFNTTAWNGAYGENGDACAWEFGTTKLTKTGAHYNNVMGGHPYLIQLMLRNDGTSLGTDPGTCVKGK